MTHSPESIRTRLHTRIKPAEPLVRAVVGKLATNPDWTALTLDKPCGAEDLPITLLHPVFGRFFDGCDTIVLAHEDYDLILNLSKHMRDFHADDSRMHIFNNVMNDYLGTHLALVSGTLPSSSYIPDGHALVDDCVLALAQAKLEVGATRPHIGFAGAGITDDRARVDGLTPSFPLFWRLRDKPMIDKAAKTFTPLKSAASWLNTIHERQTEKQQLPRPNSYTPLEARDRSVKNECVGQLEQNKLVFHMRDSGGASSSSSRGAALALSMKFALNMVTHLPTRVNNALPDGWIMVVMEHSDHTVFTPLCHLGEDKCEISRSVPTAINATVDTIHVSGHAHRDVCDTNLMVSQPNVGNPEAELVDFDWGGKIGGARYPMYVNYIGVTRPVGSVDGALITEAHDVFMLGVMFPEKVNGDQ
ncbi:hypothetical protein FRB96_004552 [Tulasnella sp. 330]|nr:hypothetical protein FRB96_004552 [Tulasnella sp. 330]